MKSFGNLISSSDDDDSIIENFIPDNLITLVSKEGDKFYISKKQANYSGYLRRFFELDVPFQEKDSKVISLPNIRSDVLSVIVNYWIARDEHEPISNKPFTFNIDPQLLPEVTLASHFLQT